MRCERVRASTRSAFWRSSRSRSTRVSTTSPRSSVRCSRALRRRCRPSRKQRAARLPAKRSTRGSRPRFWCGRPGKARSIVIRAISDALASWPVVRQLRERDPLALGKAVQSERQRTLRPRIADAEHVVQSICPYCAVGCGQLVYVKDGEVTQIEGDPASPISRGRLCPKGAASKSYVTGPLREYKVKYRRPFGTAWEELPLDQAMEMIADRFLASREAGWEE